jgi:hypothetical protein
MVSQDDKYPDFPKLECQACQETFEVPRRWLTTPTMGNQIFIDWDAADSLMSYHHQSHNAELIGGIENLLREDAQRRGR